jgi:hypothetical protein
MSIADNVRNGTNGFVRYGSNIVISEATDVKEDFGNQSVIEPISFYQFDKWLGFTGGNVAVTVTGFLRDIVTVDEFGNEFVFRTKREQKAGLEQLRNIQAAIAHIPGTLRDVFKKANSEWGLNIGFGQIALYILLTSQFAIHTDMIFQSSMAIKTMSFEQASTLRGEWAFTLVFEKLSWGMAQYIIDASVSGSYGSLTIPPPSGGGSESWDNFFAIQQMISNATVTEASIGSSLSESEIEALLPSEDTVNDNDVNVNLESLTDEEKENWVKLKWEKDRYSPLWDFGEMYQVTSDYYLENDLIPNNTVRHGADPIFDKTLDWYRLPIIDSFPNSFSFVLGDHEYSMFWAFFDEVDADYNVNYYLRLELKKDGNRIFFGIITTQQQYNFDGTLGLIVSNFNISSAGEFPIVTMSGIVADLTGATTGETSIDRNLSFVN